MRKVTGPIRTTGMGAFVVQASGMEWWWVESPHEDGTQCCQFGAYTGTPSGLRTARGTRCCLVGAGGSALPCPRPRYVSL